MPKRAEFVTGFITAPMPRDRRFNDLTGQIFTRLSAISYAGDYKWNCLCICGNGLLVKAGHLRNGNTKSCGCLHRDWMDQKNTTHGESHRGKTTAEYKAFHQAQGRCDNPASEMFRYYGGRGIEFRFESFDDFLRVIGRRPGPGYSIDRIGVNGNYEAGNVRWATRTEQMRNCTNNRLITINGVTKCAADWADIYGINSNTIYDRINASGWCDTCAVTKPLKSGRRQCDHLK